jgi:hypothetical protein
MPSGSRTAAGKAAIVAKLSGEELRQLRATLRELAGDLNGSMDRLDAEARREYREAERSVLDARRKVETREGLLRVG